MEIYFALRESRHAVGEWNQVKALFRFLAVD
jgi:hypothetical protein